MQSCVLQLHAAQRECFLSEHKMKHPCTGKDDNSTAQNYLHICFLLLHLLLHQPFWAWAQTLYFHSQQLDRQSYFLLFWALKAKINYSQIWTWDSMNRGSLVGLSLNRSKKHRKMQFFSSCCPMQNRFCQLPSEGNTEGNHTTKQKKYCQQYQFYLSSIIPEHSWENTVYNSWWFCFHFL